MSTRVMVFPGLSGNLLEIKPLLDALRGHNIQVVRYPDWRRFRGLLPEKSDFLACCREAIGEGHDVAFFGYSFGGLIALALARECLENSRPAPMLGLLDTVARGDYHLPLPASIGARLRNACRNGVFIDRILYRFSRRMAKARWPLAFARHAPLDSTINMALQCHFTNPVAEALHQDLDTIAEPLPLRAVLFRCTERVVAAPYDLGWGALIRHLRIIDVDGNHNALRETDFRQALASTIRNSDWLSRTHVGTPPQGVN